MSCASDHPVGSIRPLLQMLGEKSVTPGKHLVHVPNFFSNDQVKNSCPNLYKKNHDLLFWEIVVFRILTGKIPPRQSDLLLLQFGHAPRDIPILHDNIPVLIPT